MATHPRWRSRLLDIWCYHLHWRSWVIRSEIFRSSQIEAMTSSLTLFQSLDMMLTNRLRYASAFKHNEFVTSPSWIRGSIVSLLAVETTFGTSDWSSMSSFSLQLQKGLIQSLVVNVFREDSIQIRHVLPCWSELIQRLVSELDDLLEPPWLKLSPVSAEHYSLDHSDLLSRLTYSSAPNETTT